MYSTIFVSHDGEELPGVSDARMVQIFLRICHFGLEETNVSFSLTDCRYDGARQRESECFAATKSFSIEPLLISFASIACGSAAR